MLFKLHHLLLQPHRIQLDLTVTRPAGRTLRQLQGHVGFQLPCSRDRIRSAGKLMAAQDPFRILAPEGILNIHLAKIRSVVE